MKEIVISQGISNQNHDLGYAGYNFGVLVTRLSSCFISLNNLVLPVSFPAS